MFDIIKDDIDKAYKELVDDKINNKWQPRD